MLAIRRVVGWRVQLNACVVMQIKSVVGLVTAVWRTSNFTTAG